MICFFLRLLSEAQERDYSQGAGMTQIPLSYITTNPTSTWRHSENCSTEATYTAFGQSRSLNISPHFGWSVLTLAICPFYTVGKNQFLFSSLDMWSFGYLLFVTWSSWASSFFLGQIFPFDGNAVIQRNISCNNMAYTIIEKWRKGKPRHVVSFYKFSD